MDSAEQSHLHLRYALQKGTERNLLCVDVVPNGLNCNCVCPVCKQDVIARNKGKKREHHFAHRIGADCPGARMTALHMLAQQILARDKKLMLPGYKMPIESKPAKLAKFDEVILEVLQQDDISTRRPDCVCRMNGKKNTLWVEIYCCHKVGEERKKDIRRRKEYCIEIDFSDLLDKNYNEDIVKARLECATMNKEWICCPEWEKEYERQERQLMDEIKSEEARRQFEYERYQKICSDFETQKDSESAEKVIAEIKRKPFNKSECCIKDILVPYGDWVHFIKLLPCNDIGKSVLYTLLRYYNRVNVNFYNSLGFIESSSRKYGQPKLYPRENMAFLEYTVALWILHKLTDFYNSQDNPDYSLNKLFTKNAHIREKIFSLLREYEGADNLMKKDVQTKLETELDNSSEAEAIQIIRICFPPVEEISKREDIKRMTENERIKDYWQYVQKHPSDKFLQSKANLKKM